MGSVASSVVGAAGGLIGGAFASRAQDRARRAAAEERRKMMLDISNINIPSIAEQTIKLRQIAESRPLTVEEEQALQQGETLLARIKTDPAFKEAQMQALAQLKRIGASGGLTPEDKYQLAQIEQEIGQQTRGAREAIMASAQARGAATGGGALAAQLAATQAGAQEAATRGLGTAAMAQKRALEAIQSAGGLASKYREQEWGEQAEAAKAQDIINRFNIQQRQDVAQRNIERKMKADVFNIEGERERERLNTDIANLQEKHNKGLAQQYFENQMKKAQAKYNIGAEQVRSMETAAPAAGAIPAGIGEFVSKVGGAVGSYLGGKEDKKKKIEISI